MSYAVEKAAVEAVVDRHRTIAELSVLDCADAPGVLRRAGVEEGQRFILGPDGSYDLNLNRMIRDLPSWGVRSANGQQAYCSDLMLTCRFLHEGRGGKTIWAVFYVQVASRDLLAARDDLARLVEAKKTEPVPAPFGRDGSPSRDKIKQFIAQRRAEGRGLPALPLRHLHTVPGATVINGVVQAPNLAMIGHLSGARSIQHLGPLLMEAGNELGWEQGGQPTPRAPWPATGQPWRDELSPTSVNMEIVHLRVACWIVIAYLSGMRDMEVRELGRDCAFTEIGADGRTRYKIRGRVYKNRKISGDEVDWVVLDIVHEAVEVLKLINDDPTHLFGYRQRTDYALLSNMPRLLKKFRDHLNTLFSTSEGPCVPVLAAETLDLEMETDPVGDEGDSDPEEPLAWAFDTRQFRRTLSWHIAHQPFGVVAGTRQYKHASHEIFEGYAGTSPSGFADEVAADKAVALLDYVEDLYHDWNEGGHSAGGAVKRVEAEFDRIRGELGDLPGAVASPERLRTMLRHLTRTLHPGALNDCFHHAETAVCGKRAKSVRQPLPMLNMCTRPSSLSSLESTSCLTWTATSCERSSGCWTAARRSPAAPSTW
ncbi:hypothetical protein ACFCZ1_30055 [Streptomyces sp. NPDC056224]|uniref:hypothetical protein n=1 Tax=Streptomyces sp. NPDC056224 TaxID=3345750 RepID=UPI0035D5B202